MPNYRYRSQEYNCCQNMNRQQRQMCPVCVEDRTDGNQMNDMPIAMAYVPWQEWRDLYTCEHAFHRGTVFAELDKPFKGMGGCCK